MARVVAFLARLQPNLLSLVTEQQWRDTGLPDQDPLEETALGTLLYWVGDPAPAPDPVPAPGARRRRGKG